MSQDSTNPADIPVGLQLFSIRHTCMANEGRDFPGVLAEVARMGYQGVEFAGYYPAGASDIRKMLDDVGLICCGAHVMIGKLLGDELEETVEFHRELGNRYLIVPVLQKEYSESLDGWRRAADLLNEIAERLAAREMFTGYHNHWNEFKPIDGQAPMELLAERTDKRVILQFDVGNMLVGGGDPAALIERYPGRCRTIHLKEHGGAKDAVIGEGEVDWQKMLPLAAGVGAAEWFIIEHERDPDRAMADVEKCLQNVRRLAGGS